MFDILNEAETSNLAWHRRRIMELEQSLFKTRTHTSLEILIFLAQNKFVTKLSAIYEITQATDASVRQHLRALEKLNFIGQVNDKADGRAKSIFMTQHGKEQLQRYARDLSLLMSDVKNPKPIKSS